MAGKKYTIKVFDESGKLIYEGPDNHFYDGERNTNNTDHDTLTRIDTNLSNFMAKFDKHEEEDKAEFAVHEKRINNLEKIYGIGIAVLVVFEVVMKWIK